MFVVHALYYIILFTKKRSKINKQSLFGMKLKKLKRMKHLFILTSSKHNWFSTFNNKSIFKLQKVISAIKLRCLRKNKMRSKWTILYCMPFSHINLFWHKKRIEFTNILCERVFIDISSFYVHANPLMSRKDYDLDWLLQIISFQSMSHLNWSWHNHLCLKFALICRFCYLTLPVAKYWFLLNQFWSFWKQKKIPALKFNAFQ